MTKATFTPWFWSYRLAAKLEAAVVICVFAGVLFIMGFLFQMPGPLVVHVQDDTRTPIKNARVRCTSPDGQTSYSGMTDVFGEAKWPGLAKGAWHCETTPPDRFFSSREDGYATVAARHPAIWIATIERGALIRVNVVRPQGAPRAAVSVRAVCGPDGSAGAWEAKANLLSGDSIVYIPHGVPCRVGLVREELPYEGPVANHALDCAAEPCTSAMTGGVGQQLEAKLAPTREQWEAIRPPPKPDEPPSR